MNFRDFLSDVLEYWSYNFQFGATQLTIHLSTSLNNSEYFLRNLMVNSQLLSTSPLKSGQSLRFDRGSKS